MTLSEIITAASDIIMPGRTPDENTLPSLDTIKRAVNSAYRFILLTEEPALFPEAVTSYKIEAIYPLALHTQRGNREWFIKWLRLISIAVKYPETEDFVRCSYVGSDSVEFLNSLDPEQRVVGTKEMPVVWLLNAGATLADKKLYLIPEPKDASEYPEWMVRFIPYDIQVEDEEDELLLPESLRNAVVFKTISFYYDQADDPNTAVYYEAKYREAVNAARNIY